MHEILAGVSMARDFDIPVEVTDRARIRELWPSAVVDDLVGGVLFPSDGTVNPGDAALAFAKGAVDAARRYVPDTEVTGFRFAPDGRRVVGPRHVARPDRGGDRRPGRRSLDQRAGAARRRERRALPGRARLGHDRGGGRGAAQDAPFLRDLDGYLYIRHYRGRYVIGAFEPNGKPMAPAAVPLDGFAEFGPDWDHFAPVLAAARAAGARARVDRVRALPARAGELHARLELPARVRARGRRAVRRRRAQLAGDHLRPRRRAGGGGVDRRGAPDDGPRRGRRRADGALDEPAGVAARADASSRSAGCTSCTGRASSRGPGAACGGCRCTSRSARRARRSGRRPAGSARTGSSRGSSTRRSATTSWRRHGSRRSARRCARPARASRCTTSRRTPSSWSRARVRSTACSGSRPPTSTSTSGGSSTRCCATSAAASRWTRRSRASARTGSSCSRRRSPSDGPRRCCGAGCRPAPS